MGVAGGREEQQPPPPQQLEKQQQEDEQQQLRPQPQSPHPSSSFARASSRQQRQQRRAEEEQSLSPQPQSPHPRKKKRQGGEAFKVAEDGQSAFALQAAASGGGSGMGGGGGGGGDEGRQVGAPAGPMSPAGVDAQLLFGGARGFRNRPEGVPLPGAGAGRRRGRGGGTSFCVIS